MSFKDKLSNLKLDQVKGKVQEGMEKAKELEGKAEQSPAGEKAKERLGKLGDAAKTRFGKKS